MHFTILLLTINTFGNTKTVAITFQKCYTYTFFLLLYLYLYLYKLIILLETFDYMKYTFYCYSLFILQGLGIGMHWDSRVSINVSNRLKYNSKSCFRVHKTLFAIILPNNIFFLFYFRPCLRKCFRCVSWLLYFFQWFSTFQSFSNIVTTSLFTFLKRQSTAQCTSSNKKNWQKFLHHSIGYQLYASY